MRLRYLPRINIGIGYKIFAWYAGSFILSALVLFSFSFYYLTTSLQKQDRNEILLALNEVTALYRLGGTSAVEKMIADSYVLKHKKPPFVRIADAANRTRHIFSPGNWEDFNTEVLLPRPINDEQIWMKIPARDRALFIEIRCKRIAPDRFIQVGKSNQEREKVISHYRKLFTIIIFVLTACALGGGVFLSSRVLKPIRDMIGTVQSIDTGKMQARVPRYNTRDELDELARLFNRMLDRINNLITSMKASLENVAHDLRTPMTRLRNTAELALQAKHGDPVCQQTQEALINIIEESERILKMMDILMDIAEAQAGTLRLDRKYQNLTPLMARVVDMYQFIAEEKEIVLKMEAPDVLQGEVDGERFSQALANLVDNAVKFTDPGGRVNLAALAEADQIRIEITDSGCGILGEDLPYIWERLYRSELSRGQKGIGLGLNLVKAIIKAHAGRVAVASEPGRGTKFSIFLPLKIGARG